MHKYVLNIFDDRRRGVGITVCWFRQDLRLSDNPALIHASKFGQVLPIYILDDVSAKKDATGAASRVWLHHSLESLNTSLCDQLCFFTGDAVQVFKQLMKVDEIEAVYWNRCYEPWRISRDEKIKKMLRAEGVEAKSFNGSLLWEPWEVFKKDGTPYKVFTPYYKKGCLSLMEPRIPTQKPRQITFAAQKKGLGVPLEKLQLLPQVMWDESVLAHWQVGEESAQKKLKKFLKEDLDGYQEGRNYPAQQNVSRLSPHLHFGEISPHQVWQAAGKTECKQDDLNCFLSEIAWREFSYYLLYHFPTLPRKNFQAKFDNFPWRKNKNFLKKWQKGLTGYPIVDAGMRELWQTGYMHNRVRMIVASFLVKNLLIDWREGEKWFWDCLFDADRASNAASWQWVAGSGADAAPYFRIFNPITQGEKFDPDGTYTRHYVPELKKLPHQYLQKPWSAPENILNQAGIKMGKDYPYPLVDLKISRQDALDAYAQLKK